MGKLASATSTLKDSAAATPSPIKRRARGDAPGLFAVSQDAPGLRREALHGWDTTRRFASLTLDNVTLEAADRLDDAIVA